MLRRHAQSRADLVEAQRLPILRQLGPVIFLHAEQIAQRVLILVAVEPPRQRPALARLLGCAGRAQARVEQRQERLFLRFRRARSVLRRHLAVTHAVVRHHPRPERRGVPRIELQRRQIQPAHLRLGAVTFRAILAEERLDGRIRGSDARL